MYAAFLVTRLDVRGIRGDDDDDDDDDEEEEEEELGCGWMDASECIVKK